jgi:hypothetical protein
MQSVPITTKVVSSNPVHFEVYSIQHVITFCQWLVTGRWFSPGTLVSSTNKYDITEILLKVALNTITMTPQCYSWTMFSHMILYMFYRHIWREIPMWVSCIAQHMTLFWAHNAKRIASQCENIPKTNHFPWVWKILNLR